MSYKPFASAQGLLLYLVGGVCHGVPKFRCIDMENAVLIGYPEAAVFGFLNSEDLREGIAVYCLDLRYMAGAEQCEPNCPAEPDMVTSVFNRLNAAEIQLVYKRNIAQRSRFYCHQS